MNWFKFCFKVVICYFIFMVFVAPSFSNNPNQISMGLLQFLLAAGVSVFIVFGIPALLSYLGQQLKNKQWQREQNQRAIEVHNADEFAHQTKLRRMREEMQMRNQEEIRHLIALLEVQHKADTMKMQELARLKQQFAAQQNDDMANILAQLQRMRESTT